jgi:hypothetical protein
MENLSIKLFDIGYPAMDDKQQPGTQADCGRVAEQLIADAARLFGV